MAVPEIQVSIPGGSTDGEKFICLDTLMQDAAYYDCLVYSFGIANDWSFEESMGSLGCMVISLELILNSEHALE